MVNITIAKGAKQYYGDKVLKDINITLNDQDKIAIIGANGSGKSTLLSLLSGEESLTEGVYSKRKECNIAFLKQHIDLSDLDMSAIDYLKLEYREIFDLEEKLRQLELLMATDSSPKLMDRYGNALEKFTALGGYEFTSTIYKAANNFNYDIDFLEKNVKNFSFGEMKILQLIKLLLKEPDVLLLNEPTNHLDSDKVEILEQFLESFNGTIIFISHDRYFIDQISNSIYHIENAVITQYHGNYSFFIAQYKLLFEQLTSEYKQQQREIKRIKEQIQRYKTWGVKNEVFLVMAKRLQKKLDELPVLKKPQEEKSQSFDSKQKIPTKKFSIQFKGYSLKVGEQRIIDNLNFDVLRGDILHICGNNGAGKSTLLKDIVNQSSFENETIRFHINTKLFYLPQEIKYEDDQVTILDYCLKNIEDNPAKARSLLAKYKFRDEFVHQRISSLSGGQRVRLELIKIFTSDCNLLLLDEPTNHLDIVTKELLESFILSFSGTVLFVSHDRYFIEKIGNRDLLIS